MATTNSVHSWLYHGHVTHTRHVPFRHSFRYSLFLVFLDLDELDSIFSGHWFWSTRRPNIAWFRRGDQFGDPGEPLDQSVRDLVHSRIGHRPTGPIRLLTHLRQFGYVINPISLFFCYDNDDDRLEAVVAQVTNTPWGERHCYVIDASTADDETLVAEQPKQLHVSPFMTMDFDYHWQITPPGRTLSVHIENWRTGHRAFEATLSLQRRPITSRNLAAALVRHPLMTARVFLAIYWQAVRLWWRGATFQPHPKHTDAASPGNGEQAPPERVGDIGKTDTSIS